MSFCRDCLADAPDTATRCPACGSPRLARPAELDKLTIAQVDCDAFYATIEKRDDPSLADKPVIIENAWASCGCTTPTKPEQPIAKGKNNVIKAGFNAAAAGPFDKTVYVKVQGVDIPLELRISGEVLNAEAYAKYEAEKKSNKGGK